MMNVFLSASIVLSPLLSIAMLSPPILKIAAAGKTDAKKANTKTLEAPAPAGQNLSFVVKHFMCTCVTIKNSNLGSWWREKGRKW